MKIKENEYVFMQLPSGNHKIVKTVPNTVVSLGKFGTVDSSTLINLPFFQSYEIVNKNEVRPVAESISDELDEQSMLGHEIEALGNQTISMAEIEDLKRTGLKGDELINRITEAHRDFEKKTEFSKEKYVKRKKAKYMHGFMPKPMSADRMLDIYTDKEIARVHGLDSATLAHMLSLANVRPGGHYLVMDETPSVLVTAILERLNGSGSVTIAHENEHPNLDGLKYFPKWMPSDDFAGSEDEIRVRLVNLMDLLHPEESLPFKQKDLTVLRNSQKQQYLRQLYRENQRQWVLNRCKLGFDALITITSLDLPDIVPRLVDFVGGSAPIVVYSEYKEQLVNLTLNLKPDLRVLAPTILETRLRHFQTLPGRLHPTMTARGYSGMLLYGLRVFPSAEANAVGMAAQRKKRRVEGEVVNAANGVVNAANEIAEQIADEIAI